MMETLKTVLDIALRILGILSIPLLIWSVVVMIKNLKKPRPLRTKDLVVQTLTPVAVFIVYALLLGLDPPRVPSALLLVAGLALGALSSRATRLWLAGGQVIGRRSVWYLVAWSATFAITQALSAFARPEYAAWGFSTMYFSFGLTLGTNAMLAMRRQRVLDGVEQSAAPPATPALALSAAAAGVPCASCGHPSPPGARFCTRCGVRLA